MLTDRFKPKTSAKKKQKNDEVEFEDNIESMKTWVRKIEQSTQSISSRLAAIERRISSRPKDSSSLLSTDAQNGPIHKIFSELKEAKKKKNLDETITILDTEFSFIQEELLKQRDEVDVLKEQLGVITSSLDHIKENLDELHTNNMQLVGDFTTRLDKMEKRAPPVMKIGSKEIPIEITGLIGGILMCIIAVIVLVGQKDILLSPVFLFLIGLTFLASTAFKTLQFSGSTKYSFLPGKKKQASPLPKSKDFDE